MQNILEHVFSLSRIVPYKDRICRERFVIWIRESVLIREWTGQRKPVFWYILLSVIQEYFLNFKEISALSYKEHFFWSDSIESHWETFHYMKRSRIPEVYLKTRLNIYDGNFCGYSQRLHFWSVFSRFRTIFTQC